MSTILQRVAVGDRAAVQECIDRYGGLVVSLARRMCPGAAEVDDAVQEVFIELWRKASRFDPAIAGETTFVAMLARRRLIDMRRRLGRFDGGEELDDEHVAPQPEVESALELRDDAELARRAFRELKPEQQRVLQLALWGGHSHQRIAELTGWPLGTVKTHARRGLMRLRELLDEGKLRAAGGVAS